jgi:protein-S-isoprenylcysteine O-methyltransferase Ste14
MLQSVSTAIVVFCWFVYLPMFIGRGRNGAQPTRQEPVSKWGILLQYAGAAGMWAWRRPLFSPLLIHAFALRIVAPVVAVVLAIGSVCFSWIALRTLGEQWSFVAGVTARHRLIQEGIYGCVRHPLYLCFFSLTLATGMVWTAPPGILLSTLLFWIGVWIRVRSEEKILRTEFGAEFEGYVRSVPAFFPFR